MLRNLRPAERVLITLVVLGAGPLYWGLHLLCVAHYASRHELNDFTAWIMPALLATLVVGLVTIIFWAYMMVVPPIRWELRRNRRQLRRELQRSESASRT